MFNFLINFFREIKTTWRATYIPPLMVYFVAGLIGFTGIIESFFVKGSLTLTPENLAALGFWLGIPWAMKAPFGHLVDRFWKHKAKLIYLGGLMMFGSIMIMVGLTKDPWREAMIPYMSVNGWYVLSSVLVIVGLLLQDVVADAMTVSAVPRVDDPELSRRLHTTMQTLGRIAQVGGAAIVAGAGGWLAEYYDYNTLYTWSLVIPVFSVLGVMSAKLFKEEPREDTLKKCDWRLLGGSMLFFAVAIPLGLSSIPLREEIIFFISLGVYLYLMSRIFKPLAPEKRLEIFLIGVMIFVFRMTPGCGAGLGWWEIDVLGFDESFFGTLSQTGSLVAIAGMFMLRSWMTKRPIPYLIVFLVSYSTLMFLPYIGMYYGLHTWTMQHWGFGAQTIAFVDTAAAYPLIQVAMIPMLAWIAREAPANAKATYFAVMAGFTNLALSASQLGTKYINQIWIVERGQYANLEPILIWVTILDFVIPVVAVVVLQGILKRKVQLQ